MSPATRNGFDDVGWRVGPGATIGGEPAEFSPSDTVNLSFVAGFSALAGN
jgi:hypothetical protein